MWPNLYPFPTNEAYLHVFLKYKILFMNDSFFPRMKWNEAERYLSGFNKLSKTQSLVTETSKTFIPLSYMMLSLLLCVMVWYLSDSKANKQKKTKFHDISEKISALKLEVVSFG